MPPDDLEGAVDVSREDIPERVMEKILDLARYAPSSMNGQPWHFFVIRRQKTKKELVRIKNRYCPPEKQEYQADFLLEAPVVVIVCVDKKKSYDRGIENAVLATSHILLAAADKGLSGVYMSAYKAGEPGICEDIRKAVRIPKNLDPITLIPLGYPGKRPEPKRLRPLRQMITHDASGE